MRTSVGLDVHARSVVGVRAGRADRGVVRAPVDPGPRRHRRRGCRSLPGPVAVTYEAGPTGFGLARFLTGHGYRLSGGGAVEVAAPVRGSGQDRCARRPASGPVAASGRDRRGHGAERGAGGGAGSGAGPGGRPRGSDVAPGTGCRSCCCATGSSTTAASPGPGRTICGCAPSAAARCSPGPGWGWPSTPPTTRCWPPLARRDRLDAAITAMAADSAFTPVVGRLGCLRGVSTLTAFGLAVEIGDWHRLTGRSIGAYLGLVPTESSSGAVPLAGLDHQDRQRPRPPAADRSGLAPPHALPRRGGAAAPAGPGRPGRARPRTAREPAPARPLGRVRRPAQAARGRQHRHRPRAGRLVLVAGRAGLTAR